MEIVAFNEDDKADGSGKAKITWISKDLLNNTYRMDSENNIPWADSDLRSTLQSTIKALIPSTVRDHIVEVTKTTYTETSTDETTSDDVWVPSRREINLGAPSYESTGAQYSTRYTTAETRKKKHNGVYETYWTRSANNTYRSLYSVVLSTGNVTQANKNSFYYIALGFCTGN